MTSTSEIALASAAVQGLYPIIDLDALANRGLEPLKFAECVLEAKPPLLQLRAKHQAPSAVLELLRALRPLCDRAGTSLFANDRPDLALLARADGVHLGQEDLPLPVVRRFAPGLRVGVSTHDFAQLARVLEAKPDYVAFGPVFATRSKERPDPVVGLEGLRRAAETARRAGIPLVAIGGIEAAQIVEIKKLGVLVAVIGALLADSPEEVKTRASNLQAELALKPA